MARSAESAAAAALPIAQTDFDWVTTSEPHAERRRQMLHKYPQLKALYGPCARTKYICTALVFLQLGSAYLLKDASWWLVLVVAYVFGGVINQALLLAIHELSHNLAFRRPYLNRWFGYFVNLPVGLPVSATFRRYHLLHHAYQGTAGVDTDLPTALEGRWVRTPWRKTLWMLFQALFYALRPLFVLPLAPNRAELANFVIQFTFNALLINAWGWKAFLYLPLGSVIAMGLHPVAGHYLSEHYVFTPGQETYSYYGPLNRVTFNVGYHNEHHDFPYIAGSRLARVRALAPEFYDSLTSHHSWSRVIWRYLTDPQLGAFSRVKRQSSVKVSAAEPQL